MRVAPALPFVLVAGIVLAACSDSQPGTPTSPEFAAGGLAPSKSGCDTKQLAKDVDAAWAPNTATNGTVSTLVKALASALQNPPDSVTATAKGFEILDAVARGVAVDSTTTAALASPVAVDVVKCMVLGVSPDSLPSTFVDALGPHGAFAVRGKSSDTLAVVSHDLTWSIKPVSPNDWRTVEGTRSGTFNNANYTNATNTALRDSVRALFLAYGMPDSSLNANITNFTRDQSVSPVFDWFTLPREVFQITDGSAGVQITQCGAQGFLQHNPVSTNNQVVLASFVANCPSGPLAGLSPLAPRSLAQRLWHFFAPEPAYAVALSGGSSSKGSNLSPWGVVDPGYVNLVFAPQKVDKSNNQVGVPLFDTSKPSKPLQVTAFSKAGSPFKQGSIFTWIEAINNQGTNVLVCNNWAYTDANGVATFTHAYLNKSGGYTLRFRTVGTKFSTSAGDTPIQVGEGPNPPTSNLFNVKNGTPDENDCNVYVAGQNTLPSP